MKKLMVIATVVFMVSCGNNETATTCQDSTVCNDTTCIDSTSVSDSTGIKQIQVLDSLSKEGKI